MARIQYQQFAPKHFSQVVKLATDVHGENYLSQHNIEAFYQRGLKHGINASWVALDGDLLVGFRITYSHWQPDKWCSPELWQLPSDKVCYFKCNTVDANYRGKGIGSAMLKRSIACAKQQGYLAGLAHIWLDSPNNSAFLYFSRCGGKTIRHHPDKWQSLSLQDNFSCPLCGPLCHCSAAEMLLKF